MDVGIYAYLWLMDQREVLFLKSSPVLLHWPGNIVELCISYFFRIYAKSSFKFKSQSANTGPSPCVLVVSVLRYTLIVKGGFSRTPVGRKSIQKNPLHRISSQRNGKYNIPLTTKATSNPISPVIRAMGPVNHI